MGSVGLPPYPLSVEDQVNSVDTTRATTLQAKTFGYLVLVGWCAPVGDKQYATRHQKKTFVVFVLVRLVCPGGK